MIILCPDHVPCAESSFPNTNMVCAAFSFSGINVLFWNNLDLL